MTTLGFQLYSARNFQPFSEIYPKLKAAGYGEVEGYGALYASLADGELDAFRKELDDNSLTMPTAHFGLDMIENDPARVIKIAKTLGIEAVYCPYLMPDQRPTDASGWLGIRYLQSSGRSSADIARVIRGKADPFAWIESYGKRISAVHVKDIAPSGENTDEDGWADVGHGTVDWKGLIAALKNTRVKHFVVEHDNPKDIDRLITRSIASFKTY